MNTLRDHLKLYDGGLSALAGAASISTTQLYAFARGDGVSAPINTVKALARCLRNTRSIDGERMTVAWLIEMWREMRRKERADAAE